jgi:hypothetical protein
MFYLEEGESFHPRYIGKIYYLKRTLSIASGKEISVTLTMTGSN